ncbi:Crp/Fnr family transcriptional regulator [Ramlibacter tataouinensis]|uniref:Crp/Fnr family transcriptional regulator n=1 Tax=Ramlibacter tataouinensis TaxID=94132 RepID=UPI0022F3F7A2|nr:Crp/Fnr family transcriptional regulator [Ramlibacter tataouinensis]WBX99914.1 Crp/Fnr family transcriptional regulator [Ramlibacter tataouinensis]
MNRTSDPKWTRALEGLSHDEAESIHRLMRVKSFAPRAPVFGQGEPSDSLVVVRNGRVRLYLTSPEGEEFTMSILTSGSILGLAAVVLRTPRILSVEAVGAVDASILPATHFQECLRSIPRFAHNITQLLAVLAVETIERSAPLVLDSATLRLGRILAALSVTSADGRHLVQELTHEDLAKMIGATRTWVSLTLAEFERKGLILKQPGTIVLLDRAALAGDGRPERT